MKPGSGKFVLKGAARSKRITQWSKVVDIVYSSVRDEFHTSYRNWEAQGHISQRVKSEWPTNDC